MLAVCTPSDRSLETNMQVIRLQKTLISSCISTTVTDSQLVNFIYGQTLNKCWSLQAVIFTSMSIKAGCNFSLQNETIKPSVTGKNTHLKGSNRNFANHVTGDQPNVASMKLQNTHKRCNISKRRHISASAKWKNSQKTTKMKHRRLQRHSKVNECNINTPAE